MENQNEVPLIDIIRNIAIYIYTLNLTNTLVIYDVMDRSGQFMGRDRMGDVIQ